MSALKRCKYSAVSIDLELCFRSMAKSPSLDPTQLPFVAVRPESSTDVVDKKIIRANATRSRVTRRRISRPKLDHGSQNAHNSFCASHGALATILNPSTLTFRHIGSAFSGLSLPPGIEPHMIQDLVRRKYSAEPSCLCVMSWRKN